jgi:tryptophan 2,3-dioxygenase
LSPHSKYLTYSGYLKLDQLLSLQQERSAEPDGEAEHDEMLFIVIHQVYELWFKQLLHELDYTIRLLGERDLPRALHTLKRILTILKVQVGQLDILETMRPVDFLAFRTRLEEASGLQSFQFRELEFLLGGKRADVLARYPGESEALVRLQTRWEAPTLWDAFIRFLSEEGYEIPADQMERDVTLPLEPSEGVQAALVQVYRADSNVVPLCERLVDLDEGLQEWRYRHVKMVERTIGGKQGTGGTTGVSYLRSSLGHALFPDLWTIRTQL